MNKYKHLFKITALLAILEAVFLLMWCNTKPELQQQIIRDTIPGDSIIIESVTLKPEPYFIDTGVDYYFHYPVDTFAILKDYFAKAIYLDTLKDDSSAFIAVLDTVFMNRLQGRRFYFQNRRLTQVNTTYYDYPGQDNNLKLYAGVLLTLQDQAEISPSIIIASNKIAGSYAFGVNNKTHMFTFTYRFKLFNRKVPPD